MYKKKSETTPVMKPSKNEPDLGTREMKKILEKISQIRKNYKASTFSPGEAVQVLDEIHSDLRKFYIAQETLNKVSDILAQKQKPTNPVDSTKPAQNHLKANASVKPGQSSPKPNASSRSRQNQRDGSSNSNTSRPDILQEIISLIQTNNDLEKGLRNEQEEIWDCICSLGKKIRIDFKKSATIQSTLREHEEDIQDLNLLREKSGKILGMKTGDGKSNGVNSSKETEENNLAQCPIQDAYWSSEKEKKLLSLQEQNKSHEDSLITLLNAKRDMAEENSNLKRKLEESERNFLKKSKEADNLKCEKQTLEDNFKKRLDLKTRPQLAQMQMEMQTRDLTSYK